MCACVCSRRGHLLDSSRQLGRCLTLPRRAHVSWACTFFFAGAPCPPTLPLPPSPQAGESANFRAGVADVLRLQGPAGLFRGFVPVMLRAFPCSAAALGGIHLVEAYYAAGAAAGAGAGAGVGVGAMASSTVDGERPLIVRRHTEGGGRAACEEGPALLGAPGLGAEKLVRRQTHGGS